VLRRIFTLASLLLLLLCGVSLVVPFGQHVTGRWGGESFDEVGAWLASRGSVHFVHTGAAGYVTRSWSNTVSGAHIDSLRLHPTTFGFAFVFGSRSSHFRYQVSLPLWLPAVLVSVCLGCTRWLAHRRVGLCSNCYYDLTGNVSGICPECGTAVGGKAGA
jgi:hypothetical protein